MRQLLVPNGDSKITTMAWSLCSQSMRAQADVFFAASLMKSSRADGSKGTLNGTLSFTYSPSNLMVLDGQMTMKGSMCPLDFQLS